MLTEKLLGHADELVARLISGGGTSAKESVFVAVNCSERKNPPASKARKISACGVVGRKRAQPSTNRLLITALPISTWRKPIARMIGAAVIFMVIAPAEVAKVKSPEEKASSPKPNCSIIGSRKGKAPIPMREIEPPSVAAAKVGMRMERQIDDRVRGMAGMSDVKRSESAPPTMRPPVMLTGMALRPINSKPNMRPARPSPARTKPRTSSGPTFASRVSSMNTPRQHDAEHAERAR